MPKEELRRRVIPVHESFVEVNSTYLHFEGTNDYTKEKTIIEDIVDKFGKKINLVWEEEWKEVVPGIVTREDLRQQHVRIHQRACPVRIKFQNYHEYGEYDNCGGYDDYKDSPVSSYYYWVQYESGRQRFIKRVLYLGIIALIAVSAMFIREQYHRRLLRWELDQVENVKVVYYGENFHPSGNNTVILAAGKNKDLISELYKKIASIKLVTYIFPDEDERQESDPLFEIIFTYKNGRNDRIESTETGKCIYRCLLGAGWVGGACEDLPDIIKSLVVRDVPERR